MKDYSDWSVFPTEDEVLFNVFPKAGNAILFEHRLLHDAEEVIDEDKIILFTDLIYEKI